MIGSNFQNPTKDSNDNKMSSKLITMNVICVVLFIFATAFVISVIGQKGGSGNQYWLLIFASPFLLGIAYLTLATVGMDIVWFSKIWQKSDNEFRKKFVASIMAILFLFSYLFWLAKDLF